MIPFSAHGKTNASFGEGPQNGYGSSSLAAAHGVGMGVLLLVVCVTNQHTCECSVCCGIRRRVSSAYATATRVSDFNDTSVSRVCVCVWFEAIIRCVAAPSTKRVVFFHSSTSLRTLLSVGVLGCVLWLTMCRGGWLMNTNCRVRMRRFPFRSVASTSTCADN